MQLQTKQVKQFQQRTRFIKNTGLLPILDYILLKDGYLIKTNMSSWAKMKVDADEAWCILLEEKELFDYAGRINGEVINIRQQGALVELSSTGNYKGRFQKDDPINYPNFPVLDGDGEVISNTKPFSFAASCILRGESIPTFKGSVHSLNGLVWGGDGNIFYSYRQEGPNVIMREECVVAIAQHESVTHHKSDNYDFYVADGMTYGFIGSEIHTPDIAGILADKDPSESTLINRQWLLSFCDACMVNSPKTWTEVRMRTEMNTLFLTNEEPDWNKSRDESCPCDIEMPAFNFNAFLAAQMLRALPYEQLRIYRDGARLTVKADEDPNYLGIIQGLVPNL